MIKIAIIGSGIMGISQALALSQHFQEKIQVVVFDAHLNDGEASFSGQSRAHGGGSSMLFDTTQITNRKYVGQAYLNVLGALDKAEEAVYGFESNARYSEFMAKAAVAGVPFKPFEPDTILRSAFSEKTDRFTLTFEHPINFARTRFGMLQFLRKFGDSFDFIEIEERISTIEVLDNGLLRLSNNQVEFGDFDIVINSAGRFTNEINVLGREQKELQKKTKNSTKTNEVLKVKQATWPFFSVPLTEFSESVRNSINRVLVQVDGDEHPWMATLIVHQEGIVTLDTKSPRLITEDNPSNLAPKGPRRLDLGKDDIQRAEFDQLREAFPIINNIEQDKFRVVYGVHGRTFGEDNDSKHYTPSDIMEIYEYEELGNYIVPFGGLATSCVRDGFEVANYVANKIGLAKFKDFERVKWLIEHEYGLADFLQNKSGRSSQDLARWER